MSLQLPPHLREFLTGGPSEEANSSSESQLPLAPPTQRRSVNLLSLHNPRAAQLVFSPTISSSNGSDRPRQFAVRNTNGSGARRPQQAASIHPNFRRKSVCRIACKYCEKSITERGMKAILLADTRVELFSTDNVPNGRVQLGMNFQ